MSLSTPLDLIYRVGLIILLLAGCGKSQSVGVVEPDVNLDDGVARLVLVSGNDPSAKNVGRASVQYALEHLSNLLVYTRAVEGAHIPPESSEVLRMLNAHYSLEELEQLRLWERLEEKILTLGGGGNIPQALVGRYR